VKQTLQGGRRGCQAGRGRWASCTTRRSSGPACRPAGRWGSGSGREPRLRRAARRSVCRGRGGAGPR
jgi:hypothetical protein